MAKWEIDSFILKFKNLLLSGRNATLVLKSNAGKAEINLNVELGDVLPQHGHGLDHNGSSRQRRKLRRAAEREAARAEEDAEEIVSEITIQKNIAEEASIPVKEASEEVTKNKQDTLRDEFCPDKTFESESRDDLIEKLLITADCQADWNNAVVTKLVNEKLNDIGIRMKSIIVNRNIRRCFESCLVTIEAKKRKLIEDLIFPMRRWTMKCISD